MPFKNCLFVFILFCFFNYSFADICNQNKPVISSFKFENGLINCNGTGFSTTSSMTLIADGMAYAISPSTSNAASIAVTTPIPGYIERFNFQLIVDNQTSDIYSFVNELSSTFLNLTGGTTNVDAIDFIPTSDISMLKLFINGIESSIISVTPGTIGSITFNYPPVTSYGFYSFVLKINDVTILNSQIRYYKYIPKLFSDQLIIARRVLEYAGIVVSSIDTDPCTYTNYITCLQHNSMFLYVDTVLIYSSSNSFLNISEDLTTFWNASSITISGKFNLIDHFYLNMYRFKRLNYLSVSYQLIDFPASTVFPTTLETFVINMYGGSVNNRFYNSNLKQLNIYFGINNFNVSPCPVNNKLEKLFIPVTPTQGLPQNGFNLLKLDTLSISVNDYQFTLPNDFNIQFPNIPNLEFRFGAWSGKNTFEFPSSVELLTQLKSLSVYGDGFITPQKGYFELLNSPYLTVLFFEVSQNYFAKVNPGSTYYLSSSNVPVANVDFTNYISISIVYNNYEQLLPVSNINFNKIRDISFTNSAFYGDVPSEYCKVPKKALDLQDNNLNGTVPSCFACFSTPERELLLPNPYSNFDANTPRTCPSFNIQNSNIIGSNSVEYHIPIAGTDLGFSVSKVSSSSPDIVISKPNTELTITLPPGIDTTVPHQYLFHDGLISFSFTFSYPPLISSFSFNSNNELVVLGNGFSSSSTSPNTVVINGVSTQVSTSNDGSIKVPSTAVSQTSSFSFYILVGTQQSNTVGYSTSTSLSVNSINDLNIRGGSIVVTGNFGQYIDSLFSISINNEPCTFTQLTSTSVNIIYPVVTQFNTYSLKVYSNGQILTSTATYTIDSPPITDF